MVALRLCRGLPAAAASSFVLALGLGFLPSSALGLALVGHAVGGFVLATGWCDRQLSRWSSGARRPTPAECDLVEPALALAAKAGWPVGQVLVRRRPSPTPVTCRGRQTVVVALWVCSDLDDRRSSSAHVAALVAHALAAHAAGPTRFDLASRWWQAPLAVLWSVASRVGRWVAWVPFAEATWTLRFVPGVVAVAQGFQSGGSVRVGISVGVLVALTYIVPWSSARISRVVRDIADEAIGATFLAAPLVEVVRASGDPERIERVHRIRCAGRAVEASPDTPGREIVKCGR